MEKVLRLLLYRQLYYLALKICAYLGIPNDFVLVDWASQKIKKAAGVSDETLRDQIRENLKSYPAISYKEIANVAFSRGNKRLATMLLEFEPNPAERVANSMECEVDSTAAGDGGVTIGVTDGEQ